MKTAKTNSLTGMQKSPATSRLKSMTHSKMTQTLTISADQELEALLDSDEDKIMHLHDNMTYSKWTQTFTPSADKELEALLDSDEDQVMHLHD